MSQDKEALGQGFGHIGLDDLEDDDAEGGGWLAIYADMMTLLMCFFVLILSFSIMDQNQFGKMAGAIEEAFGVQRKVSAVEIPMGTSLISDQFAPGRAEPTVLETLFQITSDTPAPHLKVTRGEQDLLVTEPGKKATTLTDTSETLEQQVEQTKTQLEEILQSRSLSDQVEILWESQRLTIRLLEQGAFAPASDKIQLPYFELLEEVGELLATTEGNIAIEGHTDSTPIHTDRFRSNFELSSARAVSVADVLIRLSGLPSQRFRVVGHADGRPIANNRTHAGRTKNRRVEIVWHPQKTSTPAFQPAINEKGRVNEEQILSVDPDYLFELSPDEVF